MKRLALVASLLVCTASAPFAEHRSLATATLLTSSTPYLPGSRIAIAGEGIAPPYQVRILGNASVQDGELVIPSDAAPGSTTIFAANPYALAARRIAIASPPAPGRAFIAVASYDDGVVLHRASAPFSPFSVLGIGGAPSDVAIDISGRIAAADTDADTLSIAALNPWTVAHFHDIPLADEIAFDERTHALFITNRDVNGKGALTRIDASGSPARAITGDTAEGLAIDQRRQLVYVANVNDGTVSVVDAATMRIRTTFHAVARDFSLALSNDGNRLYVVSNQSRSSILDAPGGVVAYALNDGPPHLIARSAILAFPVGIAYDHRDRRIFVTDERENTIDVLDARTLRPVHAPLPTGRVPWLPTYDPASGLLYVPCSRSGTVDVFDGRTLARMEGAPFATGGYPLAIAVWHPIAR
ncbi:MAG: YncE family protein [Vulcanimicrobiaceae bacterium]